MIDLSRVRLKPAAHQVVGVEALVRNPYFLLADEMGAGKTKQVIDAAQILALDRTITQVVVVAPAPVRAVWFDPELGELEKHLWEGDPHHIIEYHQKSRFWGIPNGFRWIITNYEFIRSEDRLKPLLKTLDKQTLLVLDESSFIKSHRAKQTVACRKLRRKAGWVWLLNGTPIAHSPMDLFSQGNMMHPSILDCQYITHYKARYAVMGGYVAQTKWGAIKTQVVKWKNLEDLQQRFAPYVLRRLTKDFQDWPAATDPVPMTVPLSRETWKRYKEMRDDLITWFSQQTVAVSPMAGTKIMRLAQICAGYVGGLQEEVPCPKCNQSPHLELPKDSKPEDVEQVADQIASHFSAFEEQCQLCGGMGTVFQRKDDEVQEISDEKLKVTVDWIKQRFEQEPNIKLLIWSNFRHEVERLWDRLMSIPHSPPLSIGRLWGAQPREERAEALRLLDPRTTPEGPVVVLGTPHTGALGLNLTASHTVLYTSNDRKLMIRLQSMKRVDRIGQTHSVSYTDLLATGPDGQKTVDHVIAKGLRDKEDLATWTCSAWVKALKEELNVETVS